MDLGFPSSDAVIMASESIDDSNPLRMFTPRTFLREVQEEERSGGLSICTCSFNTVSHATYILLRYPHLDQSAIGNRLPSRLRVYHIAQVLLTQSPIIDLQVRGATNQLIPPFRPQNDVTRRLILNRQLVACLCV